MNRHSLIWYLYPPFLLLILAGFLLIAGYSTRTFRSFHESATRDDLLVRARLLRHELTPILLAADWSGVDQLCKELKEQTSMRMTVILPAGQVAGDSERDPAGMDLHADRTEFIDALKHPPGSSIRFSDTLRESMMYVAIPVEVDGRLIAVVRTAMPLTRIAMEIRRMWWRIINASVVLMLLAAWICFVIARRMVHPLTEMDRVAQQFAAGRLDLRIPLPRAREPARLADTLNRMAQRLSEELATIRRQKDEQEALFTRMVEGILVVDRDEQVVDFNEAAARFLGFDAERAPGRSVRELIRVSGLHHFVSETVAGREFGEIDLVVPQPGNGERYLQVHGSALRNDDGSCRGGMFVFHDVTRLRRLETLRRDLVANVSHELKTPITSITGAAEALVDGPGSKSGETRHFLEMILRHAKRLNAMVDDLLSLSRIEHDTERREIPLEILPVAEPVEAAIEACQPLAGKRQITLSRSIEPALLARINPTLLEQAVANLIDNALKYSEAGSTVQVSLDHSGTDIRITVADQGCGIEPSHLPRLFERFYRVDPARSRQQGGTGLGLAIVKHIALAHGGRVEAASTSGKGSTFTLIIPAAGNAA